MKMIGLKAVALFVVAAPVMAFGQMSGVSRPDETVVTTSAEGVAQPVVYVGQDGAPVAGPVLKQRPSAAVPMNATGSVPTSSAPMSGARVNRDGEIITESSAYVPYRPSGPMMVAEPVAGMQTAAEGPDVDGGVIIRVAGPANQLPLGTLLKVRMHEDLSTTRTVRGTEFSAELTEAVERDGRVLLPVGSIVTGKVTEVHGGRRVSGAATIRLQPELVTLPDGIRYSVQAQVIDTGLYKSTKVDTEGSIVRRDTSKETAAVFALTTGAGAAAGGLIAGVPGALVGGAVGAGVSTVVWLKKDRQADLPVNTQIVFALTEPLVIGR